MVVGVNVAVGVLMTIGVSVGSGCGVFDVRGEGVGVDEGVRPAVGVTGIT